MPALKEMKPTYKIFVLDSEEYDSLHKHFPMKKEDLEGSFGFSYGKTKEAFVRRTAYPEWDEATIVHEAMELLAKHSEHEDINNIRWKKGKDIFSSIIPGLVGLLLAPFTAGASLPIALGVPALGAAGTAAITQKNMSSSGEINPLGIALSGAGGALGAGAMAPGMAASSTGSYLGKLGSGLLGTAPTTTAAGTSGLVGSGGKILGIGAGSLAPTTGVVTGGNSLANTFNASQAANPLLGSPVTLGGVTSNITGGVARGLTAAIPALASSIAPTGEASGMNLLGNTPKTTTPSISATQPSRLTSAFEATQPAKPFSVPTSINTPTNFGSSGLPAIQAPVEVAPKTGILGSLGKEAGKLITPQNILGAGSLLGSTMGETPEFQMPDTVEQIRAKLLSPQGGLTQIGQQAQLELGNILKSTPQELYPPQNDAYYQAALRRTRDSYATAKKNLDAQYNLAGVYGSGEHLAAQDKLQQQLTNAETDLYAQTEARNFELARTAKYQAIQDSLGVDKNVMDDLVGLTGLDVQTAAMVYGAKVKDVKSIREALGTIGSELLTRGTVTGNTQQAIQ